MPDPQKVAHWAAKRARSLRWACLRGWTIGVAPRRDVGLRRHDTAMKIPIVPAVSLAIALASLAYIHFDGEFFPGVLGFGIGAIGLRIGLSTRRRRAALTAEAVDRHAELRAQGHTADPKAFVAAHVREREASETKKALAGLVIAVGVVAAWIWWTGR